MRKEQQTRESKEPKVGTSGAIRKDPSDWFGSMKDTFEIIGDIVSPANDEQDWEVLRD